jgi:hypothetical protein
MARPPWRRWRLGLLGVALLRAAWPSRRPRSWRAPAVGRDWLPWVVAGLVLLAVAALLVLLLLPPGPG